MNESLQFQINFFKDHTKIILCPLMGAVTYIDDQRQHRTFSFELIEKHGEYWIYACYVKQYITCDRKNPRVFTKLILFQVAMNS